MRKKLFFISLATTFIVASLGTVSYAQKPPVLPKENKLILTNNNSNNLSIVTKGFESFCSGNSNDAYTVWANHSIPIVSNAINETAKDFDAMLNTIVGKCVRYSVMSTVPLTNETQLFYVTSQHETGTLFWEFVLSQGTKGWLISSLLFSTNPTEIVPGQILFKGRQ